MTEQPKPSDEKIPAGTVTPTPPGGTPATPTPEANKPGEPTPGAPTPGTPTPAAGTPAPGASPTPGAKPEPAAGQVPISALHEERTKRQALEAEIATLKTQSPAAAPVQPQAQPQQDALRKEIDQLWDSDPKKAVQAEIMVAMNWRDQVDSNMDVEADALATKYTDFSQYRLAAQGYVRSLPLDQRSKPGIMVLAYMVVRGQNVDTIMEQQKNDLIQKYQSGELAASLAAAPAGTVTPAPTTGIQLNEDQLRAANMMGISPEDYAGSIVQPAKQVV